MRSSLNWSGAWITTPAPPSRWWPTGLGAQDAVAGGGRYNGLSQELGGPMLPAIGFAIGEDRLLEVLPQDLGQEKEFKVFLAALGEPARDQAFGLMQELRQRNVAAEMDLEGRSLKAQMTQADRSGAAYAVILGDRELETGEAQVRPLRAFAYEKGGGPKLKELPSGRIVEKQESVKPEGPDGASAGQAKIFAGLSEVGAVPTLHASDGGRFFGVSGLVG